MSPRRGLVLSLCCAGLLLLAPQCFVVSGPGIQIAFPFEGQVSEPGSILVRIVLPVGLDPAAAVVTLDGATPVPVVSDPINPRVMQGVVDVTDAGVHQLTATAGSPPSVRSFEIVEFAFDPDECEVLNAVTCFYPWPSSRFLQPDATTGTNLRMSLPASGFPDVLLNPIDPTPYNQLDGFSPTVQVLMHFPSGVDIEQPGVSRLLSPPPTPAATPYVGIRTHDDTSLQADSKTLLIHAATGDRVLHFVELDGRADEPDEIPAKQSLVLRPATALEPGERYIVAVRGLVDGTGQPVEPEAPFRVLRDQIPTTIAGIANRVPYYEANVFPQLAAAGVDREDLILAFDFTVQSSDGLTSQVLEMKSQALAWLADEVAQSNQTFSVTPIDNDPAAETASKQFDCTAEGATVWRILRGTYQVPLFLTADPGADVLSTGTLNVDANGDPVQNGLTNPPFSVAIPCGALEEEGPILYPLVLGHGLFGTGDGIVQGFAEGFSTGYIAGATDYWGLSSRDLLWVGAFIIGIPPPIGAGSQLNNFPSQVDRLKQGMINTLVLARMLRQGIFNVDPLFQTGPGVGALPGTPAGPNPDAFYVGISLGGIMGIWLASLTDDIERFNVDVPGINFASFLLQRSTQFGNCSPGQFPPCFEDLLAGIGIPVEDEPLEAILGFGLIHEIWVRGEPAGYVHLLKEEIAANTKKLLVTAAFLDKQVSNQATEVMVRSLGIPSLVGSLLAGLVDIPDVAGPVDSAFVMYDTGSFDIFAPVDPMVDPPIIPPLSNIVPSTVCDPHNNRFTIPASQDQLLTFLQPGGQIENFCVGVCDADPQAVEIEDGEPPCVP